MKLLNRLTINNLRLNKKRTFVTIIGIILATALLGAVSTFVTSFQKSLIQYAKENEGDFHYGFMKVPVDEIDVLAQNRNVESYYEVAGLGYAILEGSINEDKPYIYIEAMDKNAMEKSSFKLKEGRLPENENEIVLSNHIMTNGGVVYRLGDTLTLDVGSRCVEGYKLHQRNPYNEIEGEEERLENVTTKTFTVVGFCERLSYQEEVVMAPGYTAVTYLSENLLMNPEQFYDGMDVYARFTKKALNNQEKALSQISYEYITNEELINYETLSFKHGIMGAIFNMAIVVMIIIIFTSAFCISNSFSISIAEKIKQYGVLASVGATPKQILKNVYYEAFILGIISVPLGIVLGISACFILLKVVKGFTSDFINMDLIFCPSIAGIVIAVVLSAVTIYFSARRPAKKAAKISPILAITETNEIKLNSRNLKAPRIIKKLFGIGGVLAYKNRKRNKRKYRVSVISIAVSVAVFIALYSFMNLVFKSSDFYTSEPYNLNIVYYSERQSPEGMAAVLEALDRMEEVQEFSVIHSEYFRLQGDLKTTAEYNRYITEPHNLIPVYSVGEREFEAYVRKVGLPLEKAKEGAILVNSTYVYNEENKNVASCDVYDYKAGESITLKHTFEYGEQSSDDGPEKELKIAAVTEERPLGLKKSYSETGLLVVSDDWMREVLSEVDVDKCVNDIYIACENADNLQQTLVDEYQIPASDIHNKDQSKRSQHSLNIVVAIFLYGFIAVISLIGITSIFNTITTSMELRSREFAMLRSVGMTKKEFNRMIGLESLFYGGFALLIGIVCGNILSYVFYYILGGQLQIKFKPPFMGIIIAVAAVILLLFIIMKYSVAQIRKQNIIETIRQENI